MSAFSENSKETIKLAKLYFNKWKSKSIYQALLVFRAKTGIELSTFCQQVSF